MKSYFLIFYSLLFFPCIVKGEINPFEKAKICQKAFNRYITEEFYDITLEEYVTKLTHKTSLTSYSNNFFLNLLLKGEVKSFSPLIQKVKGFVILSLFSLVALVTLITFYFCCCFSCSIFNPVQKKSQKIRIIIYVISISLFGSMLITSIVGFVYSFKVMSHFNGATCSFLKFFEHISSGDERNEIPRWVGIGSLDSVLKGIQDSLIDIEKNGKNVFANHDKNVKGPVSKYSDKLKEMQHDYYVQVSGLAGENIYTSYSKEFSTGQPTNYFGQLLSEYIKNIAGPTILLAGLKNVTEFIINAIEPLNQEIKKLDEEVIKFNSLIFDMSSKLTDNFILFQQKIDNIILLIFEIIYGIFLSISVCAIIVLSIYTFLQKNWLKFVIHPFWCILLIFVVATFIIGPILGIVYEICKELVPLISYVLSPKYILSSESIFSKEETGAEALNSCLNGDGDLLSKLDKSGNNNIELINGFYNFSILLQESEKALTSIQKSSVIPKVEEGLNKIVDDFSLATTPENEYQENSIAYQIRLLSQMIKNQCEGIDDIFVTNEKHCPDNYNKLNTEGKKGEKNCYLLLSMSSLPSYFSNCNSKDTLEAKYNSIYCFVVNNIGNYPPLVNEKNTVNRIIYENEKLKEEYTSIIQSIKEEIKATEQITKKVINLVSPIVGGGEFEEIFNCKFVRNDVIMFIDQFLNHLTQDILITSVTCMIGSFCIYVGVFFMIKGIYQNIKVKERKLEESSFPKENDDIGSKIVEIHEKVINKDKDGNITNGTIFKN